MHAYLSRQAKRFCNVVEKGIWCVQRVMGGPRTRPGRWWFDRVYTPYHNWNSP